MNLSNVPTDVVAMWLLVLTTMTLFLVWVGKDKAQFFASLNTLNAQSWAFLILVIGVITALAFNRAGIANEIAAGIIGAAINMFTSQNKGTPPPGTSHMEVDSTRTLPQASTVIPVDPSTGTAPVKTEKE